MNFAKIPPPTRALLKKKTLPSETENAVGSSAETETAQLLHRVLGPLHLLLGLVHHVLDVPLPGSLWSRHLLKSGIFEHFSPEASSLQVCGRWLLGDTGDQTDIITMCIIIEQAAGWLGNIYKLNKTL